MAQKPDMQKIPKWEKSFETVSEELSVLSLKHDMFKQIIALFEERPFLTQPMTFADFLVNGRIAYSVMAIRRQIKTHDNSISLVGLLCDISMNAKSLTKDWFIGRYKDKWRGEKDFEKFSTNGNHVDAGLIENDFSELCSNNSILSIVELADKGIAHNHKKFKHTTTYKDLDDAVKVLERLYKRYSILFDRFPPRLPPVIQHDWNLLIRIPNAAQQDKDTKE